MDDPNEENVESTWVMINSVDMAEEATVLDSGRFLDENESSKNYDAVESDMESDGISIISESSHQHEGSNEDENLSNNEDETCDKNEGDDKKDHTSIHSASEVTVNWTFVDSEIAPPQMATSNQFYLNCLQEPVQELSEHELGSVQSDLDSDGISIISDCDSLNEFTEDDKKLAETVKEDCVSEDTELAKLPSGIKKYCNGVLIGTILLATTSIFLGQYFNSVEQTEEDLPLYKEEFSNDLKENVAEEINNFKEKYEVPTALAFCEERHKSDGIFMEHNVKKCLNKIEKRMKRKKERALKEKEINNLNEYLRIKEQYLEEKEKFLIKREYELLKAEMKLKTKRTKNKKHEKKEKRKYKNTENSPKDVNKASNKDDMNIVKEKKIYKETTHKDINSDSKYEKITKNSKERKRFFKQHHENEKKLKFKKERVSEHKSRKTESEKRIKRVPEETEKENGEPIRNIKPSDNSKENKYEKGARDKRSKSGTNYIILGNKNENETVDGYWVGRLYRGRSDMRHKRNSGDWYFDRASYRKSKRDKAKWYFDWMTDRELLRHKRSFYM